MILVDLFNDSKASSSPYTKHDDDSDVDSPSGVNEEATIRSADIKFGSRYLEEYINWDHVFPFSETPRQLCADTAYVTRLNSFTTTMESQVLYAHTQYQPEGLNLLRMSAAKYISLAREHGIPVVSYFCSLAPPSSLAGQPVPERPISESSELTALLYSIIRQAVDLLPAEGVTTSPFPAAGFSERRFSSLDGSLRTWDAAVELLRNLVSCIRLPLLLFVIDGLNLLEDDFEHTTSDQVEILTRSLRDLARPDKVAGPMVKVLFTTAGLSGALCRELDSAQVVACNASSPSREAGRPRSFRHYFLH